MIMQTLLVFAICYIAIEVINSHTQKEAEKDRADIDRDLIIDHAARLKDRMGYMGLWLALITSLTLAADVFFDIHLVLTVTASACMMWSMWTIMFRQNLNRERGLPWYYMGLDAKYDRFWVNLFLKQSELSKSAGETWLQFARTHVRLRHFFGESTPIKKAGIAAYCFESFVLLCSLSAFIYTIFKPGQ